VQRRQGDRGLQARALTGKGNREEKGSLRAPLFDPRSGTGFGPPFRLPRLLAADFAGKPINGSKVLALGVAYKSGVDDLRQSPSLGVVERLMERA
jgi:hypothetical protein